MSKNALTVENLTKIYSNSKSKKENKALNNLTFEVKEGEVFGLLGPNGAGKTTTLKAISNLLKSERGEVTKGHITYRGDHIAHSEPADLVKRGVVQVMEGRHCFEHLTVEENLLTGSYTRRDGKGAIEADLEMVYNYFPRLKDRRKSQAGYTSGGEQQMLALARALCIEPSLLLLDEPTEGLQPSMISLIRKSILELKKQGVAILLVEQRVEAILSIADEILVIENGSIVYTAEANEVVKDHKKLYRFLGV